MILLSHPTGNAFVRSAVIKLAKNRKLGEFHTTIAVFPKNIWDFLSSLPGGKDFRRRCYNSSLRSFTKLHPWRELGRMAAQRLRWESLTRHETGCFSVDAVYRAMDREVSRRLRRCPGKFDAVYAYEDGALETFRAARELGIGVIYDLPIGYWRTARRLLATERERWPEWAETLIGFQDSSAKLERKDRELALADKIIVASRFTAETLRDYPGPLPRPKIVPYGFPPVIQSLAKSRTGKLRLLFVGGLSQRKGIADLFAAVKPLKKTVELTIIGRKSVENCAVLDAALKQHLWIDSLPHNRILEEMRQHDVLIFPSLFEGFGLVITEAMSQGTPVITTDRTAGPDFIEHGRNGWLVSAGSTEALRAQIEELLKNREGVREAGHAAMETARKRPWSVYGQELAEAMATDSEK